jgi:hypothetical protein
VNILSLSRIAIITSIFLLTVTLSAGFYAVKSTNLLNIKFKNAEKFQRTPTPDGLNQAIHPSVVHFPRAWNGWRYWMAITSYANGDNKYENPSILVANNTAIEVNGGWQIPAGLKNPIISHPPGGYYADPELVYNDDVDELWLYYLSYNGGDQAVNLAVQKSADGVHWTQPQSVTSWSGIKTAGRSYSVVKQSSNWYMWYERSIDVFRVEHRDSGDGLSWSSPRFVNFIPEAQPWHLDVEYIPSMNEYWMFFCAGKNGIDHQFQGGSLYFAESVDRVNWVAMDKPVLTVNPVGWDNERIYRSAFVYDSSSGIVHLWYSARGSNREWHIGYTSSKLIPK